MSTRTRKEGKKEESAAGLLRLLFLNSSAILYRGEKKEEVRGPACLIGNAEERIGKEGYLILLSRFLSAGGDRLGQDLGEVLAIPGPVARRARKGEKKEKEEEKGKKDRFVDDAKNAPGAILRSSGKIREGRKLRFRCSRPLAVIRLRKGREEKKGGERGEGRRLSR